MSASNARRPDREIRIATVKATGEKFIVTSIDFGSGKVYTRGELVCARGLSTRHAAARCFVLDSVTLASSTKTEALVRELFAQARRAVAEGRLPGYR